jgi:hypothetical protein
MRRRKIPIGGIAALEISPDRHAPPRIRASLSAKPECILEPNRNRGRQPFHQEYARGGGPAAARACGAASSIPAGGVARHHRSGRSGRCTRVSGRYPRRSAAARGSHAGGGGRPYPRRSRWPLKSSTPQRSPLFCSGSRRPTRLPSGSATRDWSRRASLPSSWRGSHPALIREICKCQRNPPVIPLSRYPN